eukprot:913317-Rhodomonas_salina.1
MLSKEKFGNEITVGSEQVRGEAGSKETGRSPVRMSWPAQPSFTAHEPLNSTTSHFRNGRRTTLRCP